MGCEPGLGQGWMWPVPRGTLPPPFPARRPGSSEPHSAVQSPSAFVLRSASRLPARRGRASPAPLSIPSHAGGHLCLLL